MASPPGQFVLVISRRRGFSLGEVLLSLLILAALVALLVPSVLNASRSGEQTRCISNLRQVGAAGLAWIADHNRMPDIDWRSLESIWSFHPYLGIDKDTVNLKKPTVLSCPTSFRLLGGGDKLTDLNRTYTINFHACASASGVPELRHASRLNQVPAPSQMALLLEGHILASGAAERKMDSSDIKTHWSRENGLGFMVPHGGRASVVFLDGHVELLKAPDDFPSLGLSAANRRRTPFWGSLQ